MGSMLQPRREHSGIIQAFIGRLEVTCKVSHQKRTPREGLSSPYCKCGNRGTERWRDLAQAPFRQRRFQAQVSLVQSFPLHMMPQEGHKKGSGESSTAYSCHCLMQKCPQSWGLRGGSPPQPPSSASLPRTTVISQGSPHLWSHLSTSPVPAGYR